MIVATALLGGSSRPDAGTLLLLRPIVVAILGGVLLIAGGEDRAISRAPRIFLTLLAATIAVQLIPLPPQWWLSLPGHGQLAPSISLAGPAAGWRPISLYPDLTLNALIALLPAAVVVLGYARLTRTQRLSLLPWLVGIAALSAMLGLVQILGGGNSPAYLYRPTSLGLPVGLFANRNHQAVFLALALAPLSVWGLRSRGKIALPIRIAMVVGGILLSLPVIILTGSRSGLIMTFGVLLLLPWILRVSLKRRLGNTRSQIVTYAALAVVVLVVAVIGYMVSNDQATSISRLLDTNELRAEKRILAAPVMIHMLKDFFPVGIGYGAFEPLFRAYEPDALLTPTYFNRAHNDVLELAMSGGLLTIAVMVVFAGWFVQRCIALFRNNERGLPAIYARLSAVLILGLILASITDYPVRTPIITAVFALACMWLEDGSRRPPNIVESER
ncbi:O-antigen ligase family protein [Sphingomonas sp. PP-CC-3A-396]|uniref:O-antigen ligase family protein n=1 Tax=Sphingomonas sp. PP-CC-3A-396 TaxID=2135655 RepID=UPI0014056066|nr:O-antigen ligase family protein [Sphingomonas sp. PP-CC-3A-396]